jgi:hypothetical protein
VLSDEVAEVSFVGFGPVGFFFAPSGLLVVERPHLFHAGGPVSFVGAVRHCFGEDGAHCGCSS